MQWEAIIIVILILIILYVAYDQGYFGGEAKPKAAVLAPGPVMGPTAAGDEFAASAPLAPVDDTKTEGFCPKILHRFGFCDAGSSNESYSPWFGKQLKLGKVQENYQTDSLRGSFDGTKSTAVLPTGDDEWRNILMQGFTSARDTPFGKKDVGYGTRWAGEMKANTLPLQLY